MPSRSTLPQTRFASLLIEASSHPNTEAIFLRVLGVIYLAAFGSLWPQVSGLLGSHGIQSAAAVVTGLRAQTGSVNGFLLSPSLFWLAISDPLLHACCGLGCLSALLLIFSVFTRTATLLCWVFYLSLVSVGAPFLSFQWDALLLETGFLALFAGAPWLVWAYRFLLFRLMFQSGVVKLLSDDVNWSNLHALRYHFLTQPLPNPIAYSVHHAPAALLDAFTALTLAIELVAPFLLFAPRRTRYAGVSLLALLQLCIMVTGNYAFFNLLTLALCLWGLDERTLLWAANWQTPAKRRFNHNVSAGFRFASNIVIVAYLTLSAGVLAQMFRLPLAISLRRTLQNIAPFQLVNSYGLFAVMTTERLELIIEGSNDQQVWLAYEFPYKPGALHRGLPWIAPHQPRLDWQMWFAALGSYNENPWVGSLMYRILVGEPAVLRLLSTSPFPKPPRYLRAVLYNYTFTTSAERSRTGAVWARELRGPWFGPVSLTGR